MKGRVWEAPRHLKEVGQKVFGKAATGTGGHICRGAQKVWAEEENRWRD